MAYTGDSQQISLISPGTIIKGKITTEEDLRVDGNVEGDIFTKTKVIVGSKGKINGEVNANEASISGEIDGSINTKRKLVLKSNCKIEGNVNTHNLEMETGAVLNGTVNMKGADSGIKQINASK